MMYVNRRTQARNRLIVILIVAGAALIGLLFLLASLGGEKPVELVESAVPATKLGN